ncbi:SDR family NAD(P)-dependent oxidoreductase [Rhodanobacter thiooxydans]|uniref:SDR family NAD(P)-dependent oxidoreductase n=1 Tax=Rhodanobacter thiooxydans TaxID=416169 RepID=UPI000D3B8EAF|nr:SDR family NAD(P)-dependent oxidoreductase [Rhodanobacter thiooxydans]
MTTKTAWITGATSGFGAATVERFVAGGWRVIASGRRIERLQQLVDRHGAGQVHAAAFDMRDEAAMRAAIDTLPEGFAGIDLLVNNAGLALGTATAQQASLAQWKQMIDTNVTALVTLTHLLLPRLIERRGAIANISSISGSYPYRGGNVYGGTKAFVTQFSQNLRVDLHGSGVRVTSIEPGMAETEFTLVRTGGDQTASDQLYAGAHPITAADIADTLWWIANLPPHLDITRLEIMPVSQSAAGLQVHRDA